jgi:hypothetical protein
MTHVTGIEILQKIDETFHESVHHCAFYLREGNYGNVQKGMRDDESMLFAPPR